MSRRTRAAVLVALLSLFACAPALEPSAREGERRVTLLAFSDLHSRLLRSAGDPGLGALAACLTAEAATADHPVFVLDAGDLVEGGILFPRFGGEPELRAAALLGVDAQALGNHDQQLGPGAGAELRRRLGVSPPLAANLPGGVPFRVLDRDGVTVGVVGVGHDGQRPGAAVAAAAAQRAVDLLRPGVDLVVLLSHLGTALDREVVRATAGIDVVVGGHSHDEVAGESLEDCGATTAAERGCAPRAVLLVHPPPYGAAVARIDVRLGPRGEEPLDLVSSTRPVDPRLGEDPRALSLLRPFREALDAEGAFTPRAFAPEALTRRPGAGGRSRLGTLVLEAVAAATLAPAVVLPRSALRADVPAGWVTRETLVRALPFDDRAVRVSLSGAALRTALRRAVVESCGDGRGVPFELLGLGPAPRCDAPDLAADTVTEGPVLLGTSSFVAREGGWFPAGSSPPGPGLAAAVEALLAGSLPCPGGPPGLPCASVQ